MQIAAGLHPDSALIDIQMPGMDGFAVALALRHLRHDVLLIAVSGWPASRTSRELISRFDHYLLKPFAISDLLRLLQLHSQGLRGAEGIKAIPVRGPSGEAERRECADDPFGVRAKGAWAGTPGEGTPGRGP